MEKKSLSWASRSAVRAAAGVSTITPRGSSGRQASPSRSSSPAHWASIVRTRRTSDTSVTMGSSTRSPGASAPARSSARSWTRNSSGRAKEARSPRQPRKGVRSWGRASQGIRLSPPASRVRITTSPLGKGRAAAR